MNIIDWSQNFIYISENILENMSNSNILQNIIYVLPESVVSENIVSNISIKLKINPFEIVSTSEVGLVNVTDIILTIQTESIVNESIVSTVSLKDPNAQLPTQPISNNGGGALPSNGWKKYALRVKKHNGEDDEITNYKPLRLKKTIIAKSIISSSVVSEVKVKQIAPIIFLSPRGITNKNYVDKVIIDNPPYIEDEEILLLLLAA